MTVFLLVLKIIGFILLGILALVLLLLLAVLFVPVRYSGRGLKEKQVMRAEACATWFLHLVRFNGVYEKKAFKYTLKVLFFTIMKSDEDETNEEEEEDFSFETEEDVDLYPETFVPETRRDPDGDKGSEEGTESAGESKEEKEEIPEKRDEEDNKEPEEAEHNTLNETKPEPDAEAEPEPEADSTHEISLKDRIVNLVKNRDYLERAWEKKKDVIMKALGRVKKLIIHILPKKMKGYVEFGFEDPALTGELLGIIAVLYSRIGHQLKIRPDFENRVFNADVTLKGKIRIFTVLLLFVLVYFNKELRRTWKYVRHLSEVDMDEERAKNGR